MSKSSSVKKISKPASINSRSMWQSVSVYKHSYSEEDQISISYWTGGTSQARRLRDWLNKYLDWQEYKKETRREVTNRRE